MYCFRAVQSLSQILTGPNSAPIRIDEHDDASVRPGAIRSPELARSAGFDRLPGKATLLLHQWLAWTDVGIDSLMLATIVRRSRRRSVVAEDGFSGRDRASANERTAIGAEAATAISAGDDASLWEAIAELLSR